MFKKTRRKIVITIMSILVIIWAGTLAVIYSLSYYDMSEQNRKMLSDHSAMFSKKEHDMEFFHNDYDGDIKKPPHSDPHKFDLATFYSVTFSPRGEVLEIQNDKKHFYSDSELKEIATNIFNSSQISGIKGDLIYLKEDKGDYILVSFMDNTVFNDNMTTIFRYILIFGGLALIVLFFITVLLAKWIVRPLEENYQKQKQFISDAGHELKTPVSVIGANSELLSRELGENQWLSNIQYENDRMGTLVKQLLELAKTENVTYKNEIIDLGHLVSGEVLAFESVAYEKGLNLNSGICENLYVRGNSSQLKQLVAILLDNAIQHNNGGTEIKLELTKERSFAKLSVINNGEPIPTEHKKRLFERFYRVDSARNSQDGHFGLGLSIAHSIVSAHGGKIDVLCHDNLVEFKILISAVQIQ